MATAIVIFSTVLIPKRCCPPAKGEVFGALVVTGGLDAGRVVPSGGNVGMSSVGLCVGSIPTSRGGMVSRGGNVKSLMVMVVYYYATKILFTEMKN